jgi:hypothetical protein
MVKTEKCRTVCIQRIIVLLKSKAPLVVCRDDCVQNHSRHASNVSLHQSQPLITSSVRTILANESVRTKLTNAVLTPISVPTTFLGN